MEKRKFFEELKIEKNKRRKIHLLVSIFAILLIVGSFISYQIYIHPRDINRTMMALKFQLGNETNTKKVPIQIKGTYSKKLIGSDIFDGTITIDNRSFSGKSVLISSHTRELYGLHDGFVEYGRMYTEDNFESFNIWIHDKVENGVAFNWDVSYMISYPAENRSEALEIANKFSKGYLGDRTLK